MPSQNAPKKNGASGLGLGKGGPKKKRVLSNDSSKCITKQAMQRLAYVAGVKFMSGTVYEEIRRNLKVFLEDVLEKALIYCEHAQRKIVESDDVLHALEGLGKKMYFTGQDETTRCKLYGADKAKKAGKTSKTSKTHKKKRAAPGERAIKGIQFYQENTHDCVHIAMKPFRRLVREIAADNKADLRFTSSAFTTLQISAEAYLVSLLEAANLAAIHAHRQTLHNSDIQLARRIRGS